MGKKSCFLLLIVLFFPVLFFSWLLCAYYTVGGFEDFYNFGEYDTFSCSGNYQAPQQYSNILFNDFSNMKIIVSNVAISLNSLTLNILEEVYGKQNYNSDSAIRKLYVIGKIHFLFENEKLYSMSVWSDRIYVFPESNQLIEPEIIISKKHSLSQMLSFKKPDIQKIFGKPQKRNCYLNLSI